MTEGLTPGDRVRLLADPARVGVIVGGPHDYPGGRSYTVFFGPTETQTVAERALAKAVATREIVGSPKGEFLIAMLLTKLNNKLGDILYTYQGSRTQFEPYQFKPVFKYLDAPAEGILIADEVGLGKTIEAAILYQELKARSEIHRVLVVCPAGLRDKWRLELLSRFDEDFRIFRTADVVSDLLTYGDTDGAAPVHAIVGLETIRQQSIQDALEENPVRFDLVIIDEAHHLRNSGTLSNQIAERLSTLADFTILLTATPLQTSQQDLFNLLRLLDETQFSSLDDFLRQLQPNRYLNAAITALRQSPPDTALAARSLREVGGLEAGAQVTVHPVYPGVIGRLERGDLDRRMIAEIQRDIDRMNVMSSIYTRTKKRDVTGIAHREAHVIHVAITDQERDFYAMALEHARAQARAKSGSGWIPGFAGMMRERQAASCIAATRDYLVEQLRTGKADMGVEDSESDLVDRTPGDRTSLNGRLLDSAKAVGDTDSKYEAFLQALQMAIRERPDSKIIVFSYFRRTLAYLERRLKAAGIYPVQINGTVSPHDRTGIIERFRADPAVQVMLTSEVGSEGLDFQFCDTLFNYDLPWNPMRVEQRIGRIDRYGQKSPKIRIYSFFLADTIEARILERLYARIGIFEESVGELEPILGPMVHDLTLAIFSAQLTPEQELAKLEQLLRQMEVRRLVEEDLSKRTAELMGQDALILEAVNDTVASGKYISGSELRAVVEAFVRDTGRAAELVDRVGDGTVVLHPDPVLRRAIVDEIDMARDGRPSTVEFIRRLNNAERIAATFDGNEARLKPTLDLFNLRHPLVRAAIAHARRTRQESLPVTDIAVPEETAASGPGTYTFAVVLFDVRSATPQMRLDSFVFDERGERVPDLERSLLRLVQDLGSGHAGQPWTEAGRDGILDQVSLAASGLADQLEAEALERNDAAIAVRSATLQRTYRARIAKRREQISRATNERIIRMWTAEVRRTEEELSRKLAGLEATRQVAVLFRAVGIGRLHVTAKPLPPPPPTPSRSLAPQVAIGGYPEPPFEDQ